MAVSFVDTADVATITARVPMSFRRRGGRKLMVAGDGTAASTPRHSSAGQPISPVVKALARAFRWQRLLETGVYTTVQELAKAERINPSYVSRILRLTLLAPGIVEAILDGRLQLSLALLTRPFPSEWASQASVFGTRGGARRGGA